MSTGALVQENTYSPFGKVLSDSSPGWQPFAYAGGLYDTQTKLVRFGARDYDAETGRWTAKDPIGFGGGSNQYLYAASALISAYDPNGEATVCLTPWTAAVCVTGAAILGAAAVIGGAIHLAVEDKTVDELLEETTPGRKTKGTTTQREKCGDYEDALDDFEDLGLSDLREDVWEETTKIGRTDDGRTESPRVSWRLQNLRGWSKWENERGIQKRSKSGLCGCILSS